MLDKNRRYKIKHRVTNGLKKRTRDDQDDIRQAFEYVDWLIARDKLIIPPHTIRKASFLTIPSATEQTKSGRTVMLKRCVAVHWYQSNRQTYEPVFSVQIPHWNWQPIEPIDQSEPELMAA